MIQYGSLSPIGSTSVTFLPSFILVTKRLRVSKYDRSDFFVRLWTGSCVIRGTKSLWRLAYHCTSIRIRLHSKARLPDLKELVQMLEHRFRHSRRLLTLPSHLICKDRRCSQLKMVEIQRFGCEQHSHIVMGTVAHNLRRHTTITNGHRRQTAIYRK